MDPQAMIKQLNEQATSPERIRTNAILELKAFFTAHLLASGKIEDREALLDTAEWFATRLYDERIKALAVGAAPKAA